MLYLQLDTFNEWYHKIIMKKKWITCINIFLQYLSFEINDEKFINVVTTVTTITQF